jgi:hypothetical protein
MECREPLFILSGGRNAPPKQPTYPSANGGYALNAHGTTLPPSTAPPVAIPLPIPKNLVLLAMMEAAERQNATEKKIQIKHDVDVENTKSNSSSSSDDEDDEAEEEHEDEEAFDLNKIIASVSTLTGPCGTYAVRGSQDLSVLSRDPRTTPTINTEENSEEKDDTIYLKEGQKIQIVEFSDGVARLARGKGFIVCTSSQLVKGKSIFLEF